MGHPGTTQGVEHGPCWNNTRHGTWAMLEQHKVWNMGHAGTTQGLENVHMFHVILLKSAFFLV
ncbi:MAG: hypothetical protein LGB62_08280 [Sulfurovum sp.]|nr:hypothetical protein [Sulfurovum sp.]